MSGDFIIKQRWELKPRQLAILHALHVKEVMAVSIGDLVDEDYVSLVVGGFIVEYLAAGALCMCHLTDKGKGLFNGPL